MQLPTAIKRDSQVTASCIWTCRGAANTGKTVLEMVALKVKGS